MHSKKSEYSVVLGCNVLYISMRSTWSSMSFKALVSLLIFCLGDLAIAEGSVEVPYYFFFKVLFIYSR